MSTREYRLAVADGRIIAGSEYTRRSGEKIEPCPFCFSEDIGIHIGRNVHVTCADCGADGPLIGVKERGTLDHDVGLAVTRWNDRCPRIYAG